MQRALNVKHFNTFVQQVKGAGVTEISVAREAGPKAVKLKYRARDGRTRKIFNGEWVVAAAGDDKGEKEFFELAEKEFVVRREEA